MAWNCKPPGEVVETGRISEIPLFDRTDKTSVVAGIIQSDLL